MSKLVKCDVCGSVFPSYDEYYTILIHKNLKEEDASKEIGIPWERFNYDLCVRCRNDMMAHAKHMKDLFDRHNMVYTMEETTND